MTNGVLAPDLFQQFLSQTGTGPGVDYLLFTYVAGTTTPQATYTDVTLSVENANPIILNSVGQNPSGGSIWLNPTLTYKFVYSPPNDTNPPTSPIVTVDNVPGWDGLNAFASVITQQVLGQILYPQTAAEIAASVTPTDYWYPAGNVLRYGADPAGVNSSFSAGVQAMQVAVAAAGASGQGNLVAIHWPAGIYKIDSSGVFNSPLITNATPQNPIRGLTIYGDGMGATQLKLTSGGTNIIWLFNSQVANEQAFINLQVRDMLFTGDDARYCQGFAYYWSQGWDMERLAFNYMNDIVYAQGALSGDSWKWRHCRTTQCGNWMHCENQQVLNTEWVQCDHEQSFGNMVYYGVGGGGAMGWIGGSIILNNSTAFVGSVSSTTLTVTAIIGTIPGGGSLLSPIVVGSMLQSAVANAVPAQTQITSQLTGGTPGGIGTYALSNSFTLASSSLTNMTFVVNLNGGGLGGSNGTYLVERIQTQLETTQTGICNITQAGSQAPIVDFLNCNFMATNGSRQTVGAIGGRVRFTNCGLTQNQSDTYSMQGNQEGDEYGEPGSIWFDGCNVLQNLSTLITLPASIDGFVWSYARAMSCYQAPYNAIVRTSRTAIDFDLNYGNQGFASNAGYTSKNANLKPLNRQWPDAGTANNWTVSMPTNAQVKKIIAYRAATTGSGTYTLVVGNGNQTTIYGSATGTLGQAQTVTIDYSDTPATWLSMGTWTAGTAGPNNQIQLWATTTATGVTVVGTAGNAWIEYY